jgi:hypothetical protein
MSSLGTKGSGKPGSYMGFAARSCRGELCYLAAGGAGSEYSMLPIDIMALCVLNI